MAVDDGEFAEPISFEEFHAGLPFGRFRVIVNPKLARRYVSQRLFLLVVLTPVIGVGLALALTGATAAGGLLVLAGVAINRLLMWQAPKILLHLAARDPKAYAYVTQEGLMEVRRATPAGTESA
jgi:hypothetical protein